MAIQAIQACIDRREVSASELVEQSLRKVRQLEPQVKAWAWIDEDGARATAEHQDRERKRGQRLGPLHGITLGIKDIVDVRGMPTRAGSALTSDQPAVEDAPLVDRLRRAGAIILGKTVTTQWACFDPPPTRNPWNRHRSPGGSSSGSAAAVAAGMCVAAIGTQTGGSIIRPASYCGVAGLKPSFGRLSRRGVVPVSHRLDHVGPIASTADDLRILYEVLVGAGNVSQPVDKRGFVLAILQESELSAASPQVRDSFGVMVSQLAQGGATIMPVADDDWLRDVHQQHRTIMACDAAVVHRDQYAKSPQQFGPCISQLLEEGLATSPAAYKHAVHFQTCFRERCACMLSAFDALLLPSTLNSAPDVDTTGDPFFNSPWSLAGHPALTIPYALHPDGLPLGLQLVGSENREDQLLQIAHWLQELIAFDQPWAP